jgi:potassium efflux system protein
MGERWKSVPVMALCPLVLCVAVKADDLPPLPPLPPSSSPPLSAKPLRDTPARKPAAPRTDARVRKAGAGTAQDEATPEAARSGPAVQPPTAAADPAPSAGDDPDAPDASLIREQTSARLEKLPKADDKDAPASAKALRQVYEERLQRLDDWEKAVKDRQTAENPESPPEKLAEEWKADLEKVTALIAESAKDPDVLLPASYREASANDPDKLRGALKEAIDAAQVELKDWSARLEDLRARGASKEGGALAAARAQRDKSHQRLVALRARNVERDAGLPDARTPEAEELAREKVVNARWELRVEAERLRGLEALIDQEGKRAENAGLQAQMTEAHVQLAQKTLERMKGVYRTLAARKERDLQQEAVREQSRADSVDDPLERYRARRKAELLELEAKVLVNENALATSPSPSLEEQRELADRAETDLTNIKKLLDDGRVSHLDALRLNNDFRRIGAERGAIARRELAITAQRLTLAENALSSVELELINDARDDRFELDTLLERLPRPLHPKAVAMCEEFEKRHAALLSRRRDALEKLASRADQTHDQVLRRLRILDEHFGFIRTNLFWVRDEEPIGPPTLVAAQRDLRQLARAAGRLAVESCDPGSWGRVSGEFVASGLGLLLLPWPLRRLRRALLRDRA